MHHSFHVILLTTPPLLSLCIAADGFNVLMHSNTQSTLSSEPGISSITSKSKLIIFLINDGFSILLLHKHIIACLCLSEKILKFIYSQSVSKQVQSFKRNIPRERII
jgi:hypothetical protein